MLKMVKGSPRPSRIAWLFNLTSVLLALLLSCAIRLFENVSTDYMNFHNYVEFQQITCSSKFVLHQYDYILCLIY